MSRAERFTVSKESTCMQRLETLIRMTITHIFSKYKESPEDTRNANLALSQFIKVFLVSNYKVSYVSIAYAIIIIIFISHVSWWPGALCQFWHFDLIDKWTNINADGVGKNLVRKPVMQKNHLAGCSCERLEPRYHIHLIILLLTTVKLYIISL